jgi:hypothetical protein
MISVYPLYSLSSCTAAGAPSFGCSCGARRLAKTRNALMEQVQRVCGIVHEDDTLSWFENQSE